MLEYDGSGPKDQILQDQDMTQYIRTSARFFPVTMPIQAERYWHRIAEQLKSSTSSTRSYPNRAPASTVATHFPRSIYAIEIKRVSPRVRKKWCRPSPVARDVSPWTPSMASKQWCSASDRCEPTLPEPKTELFIKLRSFVLSLWYKPSITALQSHIIPKYKSSIHNRQHNLLSTSLRFLFPGSN